MIDPSSPGASLVLFFSHHATIIGGGEISLLTLMKGLRSTEWRSALVAPCDGPLPKRARALGVDVHISEMPTLRRPGRTLIQAIRGIRRLTRTLGPDVVHANGTRAMFYGGLGARAAGCPSIWHLRIIEQDRFFDPILVRLASVAIANSEATRNRLRRWPAAWRRCRVVPNGLDLSEFAAQRNRGAVRSDLGLDDDDVAVVAVSRLVDFKRHDLLLDAIATLRPRHPRLRCVVIGEGPEDTKLRHRARKDDLVGSILFAGHREDVADILSAADIFVLSSPQEPFGRVVIEAMAMEVPVVAAAAGGPAEIIVNGETGLLVEPNSVEALAGAIGRLYDDVEYRHELGAAGRNRVVAEYSMESHTNQVVTLYSDLLRCGHEAR